MLNFRFNAYTEIFFGKGQIKELPKAIQKYGKRVLLAYGGGSIKQNGLYQQVIELLQGCEIFELSGIAPNPRIESVREGVLLCRKHSIDVVCAVGGGSVIDCAKVIAAGACYDGDSWDLVMNRSLITSALPIITVSTMAATGSEMNENAVISDLDKKIKKGTGAWCTIPQVSILDPEYTFTVPPYQSAAGAADIMSHIFEEYFNITKDAYVQDRFSEGILKTVIKYAPIVISEPTNYEARANLMWASTMALNGLCGSGKESAWTCHPIEHELSAYYDITHGVGLAIITPHWMRYILSAQTVDQFVQYAVNVWGLPMETDQFSLARKAIDHTAEFLASLNIPMTLREVGIDDTYFHEMAKGAVGDGRLRRAFVPLNEADVINILNHSL